MSAIATLNSSSGLSAVAQLLSNNASSAAAGVAQAAPSAASNSSITKSTGDLGPATFVTLSDQAKAAAAARAQSDQAAADQLQAYVEAHRVNGPNTGGKTAGVDSLQGLLDTSTEPTSTQLTGTQPANAPPTASDSNVEAIVAQITTVANANEPQPYQAFTPTKSLSNSVTFDGYTLTLDTNASTQFYGIELSGNGVQAFNKHFGPSDGVGSGSYNSLTGIGISIGSDSNNEAEDAITITQNTATASSASISSSSAGSTSTSSVSAESSSIRFQVNYATGRISVEEAAVSVSAQSTQVSSPGSTLSTLA